MPRLRPKLLTLLAAALVCCAGEGDVELEFPEGAFLVLTGEEDELRAEIRSSPQPPVRGKNHFQFSLARTGTGEPVEGLKLEVQPRMLAQGHLSSAVQAEEAGGGRYLAPDLVFDAAGEWELRISVTGAVEDRFLPVIHID